MSDTAVFPVDEEQIVYATPDDVAGVLCRPLTTSEVSFVDGLLERALREIERELTRYTIALDSVDRDAVRDTQADMVARKLRNPDGFRSENDGQYSYALDTGVASGRLELTDVDRARLGIDLTAGLTWWNPYFGGTASGGV